MQQKIGTRKPVYATTSPGGPRANASLDKPQELWVLLFGKITVQPTVSYADVIVGYSSF